jgi:hypothetical protein
MTWNGRFLALSAVLAGVFVASSCNKPRRLESMIIRPVSADAQDFPHGAVQYIATGLFNKPPVVVTPLKVKWTNGFWWNAPPSSNITIDQNGIARCNPGFAGATSVMAFAPSNPDLPLAKIGPGTSLVSGAAQLICP